VRNEPQFLASVRTGSLVLGWLLALLIISLAHPYVTESRWLLVHLLALGAASNAGLLIAGIA
jgi:nitrite reductase (NO-forming)